MGLNRELVIGGLAGGAALLALLDANARAAAARAARAPNTVLNVAEDYVAIGHAARWATAASWGSWPILSEVAGRVPVTPPHVADAIYQMALRWVQHDQGADAAAFGTDPIANAETTFSVSPDGWGAALADVVGRAYGQLTATMADLDNGKLTRTMAGLLDSFGARVASAEGTDFGGASAFAAAAGAHGSFSFEETVAFWQAIDTACTSVNGRLAYNPSSWSIAMDSIREAVAEAPKTFLDYANKGATAALDGAAAASRTILGGILGGLVDALGPVLPIAAAAGAFVLARAVR